MTKIDTVNVPRVVVTGADTITGLITARSLSRMKVDIWGVAFNLNAPACHSRYWKRKFAANKKGYFAKILEIGEKNFEETGDKAVLLISQDEVVISVSSQRKEIERFYLILLPEKENVDLLMDKTNFHLWAQENSFLVPDSKIVESFDELQNFQNFFKYPYILKPLVRSNEWDKRHPSQKFFYINSQHDLDKALEDHSLFQYSEKYLIQEWLPGDDSHIYFCLFLFDERGGELGYFLGRKIYQWPLSGGSTAVCTEFSNHELLNTSRKIMREAHAKGLCAIEYKRHQDTGKYYIIEPTVGRNDLQSYIGTAAGVNLTQSYVRQLLAMPQLEPTLVKKAVWIDEVSLIRVIRSKKMPGVLLLMCKLLLGRRRSYAYLDLRDPWPFIRLIKSFF